MMCLIYELDIKEQLNLKGFDLSDYSKYQMGVLNTYIDKKLEIDELISGSLKNWTIESISKIDLAILRLCITESLYVEDIPFKIAINEAVEIAKIYGDDNSQKFVNGLMRVVLDKVEHESKDKER